MVLVQLSFVYLLIYLLIFMFTQLQDIEEINFFEYQFGGMNITGFQMINRTHPVFERQYTHWNDVTKEKQTLAEGDIMGVSDIPVLFIQKHFAEAKLNLNPVIF